MPHKPRISRDEAKRLIVRWHLMGVTWSPEMRQPDDEGLDEETPVNDVEMG